MGEPPWAKKNWKDVIKNTLKDFQTSKWVDELTTGLPSLAALNPGTVLLGTPHPVWETCGNSPQAVKEAISKVRFLTDTFLTGEKLKLFFNSKSTCICGNPLESRTHILLDCPIYSSLREYCLNKMTEVLLQASNLITSDMLAAPQVQLQLFLDPSWYREDIGSSGRGLPNILAKSTCDHLERIGRKFCFQVYKRRLELFSQECEDSETEDEDSFSIHDTSEDSSSMDEGSSDWS